MNKQLIAYLKDQGLDDNQIQQVLSMMNTVTNIEVVTIKPGEWQEEIDIKEQLGIPDSDYSYHILNQNQNRQEEVNITRKFLSNLHKQIPTIIKTSSSIEFINYGDTELVYVIKTDDKIDTLLVGQPATKLGIVRLEYDNLRHLATKNPSIIVSPTTYISDGTREAYITPYIKQARCIATYDGTYGAYIPEPYYRYEPYSFEDQYLVSKTIIANLIRLYDYDNKLALAECKIGGGDFILEKEYDQEPHTEENILKRMKLIAARKLINIELKDYIELIRKELSKRTYYRTLEERDNSVLINIKNRVPMTKEAIEDGISLGLSLTK